METAPVGPDSPPAGPDSPLARVVGVFVAPVRTFASIARRPGWVLPVLISTVLSFAVTATFMPRMDIEGMIREKLAETDEKVSDEKIEEVVETQKRFSGFAYAWGAVAPCLIGLLIAAILWLSFKAFGWELSFKQSFGVTTHAFLPSALGTLLLLFFVRRYDRINPADLGDLLRSHPGFLVDRRENPVLHSLAQSIDLFSAWVIVLLVIGFAAAAKVSRGKAAAIVLTLWAVYVLGKAGVTAAFS